ncbi:MAG: hypothetical protein ACM3NP_04665 [Actinomycetota bacterium]
MRDFTTDRLQLLLSSLKSAGYGFTTVAGYLHDLPSPAVILRHDVDARPVNSLRCAEMENRLGISGTYYFRTVSKAWDEGVIREIHRLGHEIGYHYEDLAVAGGRFERAIENFGRNLARLRHLTPVETICMHGSPLTKYDNRLLWEKYDYRDFGIKGEPYFDIDFNTVLYLTDTGRRWNGDRYSIRDRIMPIRQDGAGKTTPGKSVPAAGVDEIRSTAEVIPVETGTGRRKTNNGNNVGSNNSYIFRSTRDIIMTAISGDLPPVMMITLHPQRWDNRFVPWLQELVWQNIKNVAKRFLTTS